MSGSDYYSLFCHCRSFRNDFCFKSLTRLFSKLVIPFLLVRYTKINQTANCINLFPYLLPLLPLTQVGMGMEYLVVAQPKRSFTESRTFLQAKYCKSSIPLSPGCVHKNRIIIIITGTSYYIPASHRMFYLWYYPVSLSPQQPSNLWHCA